MIRNLILASVFFILVSCGDPNVNIKKSDHFDGEVFHNLNELRLRKSVKDFFKWRFFSERTKWPKWIKIKQQKVPFDRVKNKELSVTFINHATVLIQMDGINIITDPIYSNRSSPVSFLGPKRVKLPGVKFEDLPKIDIILISHNHYDSFDIKTLNQLIVRDNPKILLGLGNAYYLDKRDDSNVIEMDWQDEFQYKNLKFIFLPAKHWSKRRLDDTNKALWGSFAIVGTKQIYFAGDTGYAGHFKEIQKQFGYFDLSLIPIGGYEPRWFMKKAHVNPKEAIIVHKELNSKKSIGIHFGTFQLTNEGIDDPIHDLNYAIKENNISENEFFVLKNGESYQD
ncbi:MAG: MBL fold metallo-hydrolase [Rickettsiales bacterium]|nr:MBL fold metallo-hydrolase [Rickettsiales bacterium]